MGSLIARLLGNAPAEEPPANETARYFSRATAEQLDLISPRPHPELREPPDSAARRADAVRQEQAYQALVTDAGAAVPAVLRKDLTLAQRACETVARQLAEATAHRDAHEARQPRQGREVALWSAKHGELQASVQAFERMAHARQQTLADVAERARHALDAYVREQAAALDVERPQAEAEAQQLMEQARAVRQRVRLRAAALSRMARTVTEAEPVALGELLEGTQGTR